MTADRAVLEQALERGEEEGGPIEFKERLSRDVHLVDGRMESLAAQLRHRVLSGDGEATYVVGVTDDGHVAGIEPSAFSESMDVLSLLAEEAGAHIEDVETWGVGREDENGLVGVATVCEGAILDTDDSHIVVGTAGHVDHGKSTLVGTLVTGQADDGQGGTRSYLDVQPHEVERGLSADLSYAVYGFDESGPVRMDNPHRKSDRARVVEESERLVSFVDTVGHEPWLRTTIRGLVGQKLDYGLLTVAADDGPTKTTREHLGILLATELPTMVAITKADLVSGERLQEVERAVERLLRDVEETPLRIERHGVSAAAEEIGDVVPILRTSAVSGAGLDALDDLFERLPKTNGGDGDFRMYIDRTYSVTGVGAVASGTVNAGSVEAGDELGGRRTPPRADARRHLPRGGGPLHRDALSPGRPRRGGPHRRHRAQGGYRTGHRAWHGTPAGRRRPHAGPRVRGRSGRPQPPHPDRDGLRTRGPPRDDQRGGNLSPRRRASPPR